LLAHGRWFSLGTPASSTTKTSCHNIAEVLLKVALKHQKSKSFLTITGIVLNHKDYSNQSKLHDIFHFLIVFYKKKGKKLYHNEDIGLKKYISIFIMQII
jgi:hypothetical protein